MATLRDIRTRIASVKNTQQVTRAMKMVAAAKLRRAQENIFKTRPYASKIGEIIDHLKRQGEVDAHPLLKEREEVQGVLLIVVTGDRGLAGAFNANIIKAAESLIADKFEGVRSNGQLYLAGVGRKGVEYFGRRAYNFGGEVKRRVSRFVVSSRPVRWESCGRRVFEWDDGMKCTSSTTNSETRSRRIGLCPRSCPFHRSSSERLLCNRKLWRCRGFSPSFGANYIFEPGTRAILNQLVPLFVNFQIWRALLESNAAEQSARMVAMDNATSNANELLRSLQLQYNRGPTKRHHVRDPGDHKWC